VRLRSFNASCERRLLRRPCESFRFGCGAIVFLLNFTYCRGGRSSTPTMGLTIEAGGL
jgi:hypothetical protein